MLKNLQNKTTLVISLFSFISFKLCETSLSYYIKLVYLKNIFLYDVVSLHITKLFESILLLEKDLSRFDDSIKNIQIQHRENRVGDMPHSLFSLMKAKK